MPINTYPSRSSVYQAYPDAYAALPSPSGALPAIAGTILGGAASALINKYVGHVASTSTVQFPTSPNIDILSDEEEKKKKRRRRRRLLTCSDKADIAYLVGQLGTGQLGRAAVSALLSRRCG